jgi:hypothetical protein
MGLWLLLAGARPASAQHDHRPPPVVGTTTAFPTSCRPMVARMFERGIGFLHASDHAAAIQQFKLVAHSDVDCAMAYWGTALAHWSLYSERTAASDLDNGRRALAQAAVTRRATPRERDFLAAVATPFDGTEQGAQRGRQRYAEAMAALAARAPDDDDAAVFAARAWLDAAAHDPATAEASRQAAASLLRRFEGLWHRPGVARYWLLAAGEGDGDAALLEAARHLADEPATPAGDIQMATRVFVRRGLWSEAMATSLRAADAARRAGSRTEELLALDALVYAQLQAGLDAAAAAVVGGVTSASAPTGPVTPSANGAAADTALATIPARLALERDDWEALSQLPVPDGGTPGRLAVVRLARALGQAQRNQVEAAWREIAALDAAADPHRPLPAGVDGLRAIAEAAIAAARGHAAEALAGLDAAVVRERARGPVDLSYGLLIPVEEALADTLATLGRRDEARAAYARVLTAAPGRRRALRGAARAAGGG